MTDGIKHKRIVVSGDKGTHDDWNDIHEITGDVDFEKHQALNFALENRANFPPAPVSGQIIYRTDYKNGLIFNGTSWKSLVPSFLIVVASDGSGDYLTIQEGIDALPPTGGIVHVKTGTYTITSKIEIKVDDTTLEGDFYGTQIITTTAGISMIENNGHDRVVIKDLLIYGGGSAKNNAGIEWGSSHEGRIENVYIANCGGLGGGMGIYMEASDGNLIINNVVRDCWGYGIFHLSCDGNIFTNNIIYDIVEGEEVGNGILIIDSNRNIINNNIIEGCEWEGVILYNALYNNFEGNMVRNNSFGNANVSAGILLDGTSTHNTILGNKSYDDQGVHTQRYGIREAGAVDNYNIVTNNVCVDNITAEISTQGANTINANNMIVP